MATNTALETHEHPPLARDAQGNLVAVPDGTSALRICRKTPGRPKEILGPDNKQPMRWQLSTTVEELADTCGPDTYRVYALDDVGKVLDFVTELDLTEARRDRRNAEAPHIAARGSTFAASTDLRFALDAIVQMMRVNGEALRAVTVAQADWVKSIASSRGFFRNAPPQPLLPEPPKRDDDDDEDSADEDAEEAEPAPKGIYDVLAPIAEQLAPAVGSLVTTFATGATNAPAAPASRAEATDLASRPKWEMRDLIDFKYAGAKAKAKKEAAQAPIGQPEAKSKVSLQARVMSDPKLLAHFMSVKSLLSPDEQAALMDLANRITAVEQEQLIMEIEALPAAGAAVFLRALLDEMKPSSDEASSNNQP